MPGSHSSHVSVIIFRIWFHLHSLTGAPKKLCTFAARRSSFSFPHRLRLHLPCRRSQNHLLNYLHCHFHLYEILLEELRRFIVEVRVARNVTVAMNIYTIGHEISHEEEVRHTI